MTFLQYNKNKSISDKLFPDKRALTLFLLFLFFVIMLLASLTIIKFNNETKSVQANVENNYIKWVEFNVNYSALDDSMKIDIDSQSEECKINWIDLLACLGAKYGGDFSKYQKSDLISIADKFKGGATIDELISENKYLSYYKEAYDAVLSQFIGDYKIKTDNVDESGQPIYEEKYGLKAFSPIASTFPYDHYKDFGAPRSYGFSRPHLGHDIMAATGTPVIAIESGTVEVMGWNQYGGWRIGIRSFDKKRYYYYAHLRQNRPYHADLCEGKVVTAGDVIGYVGRTGYSVNENVNNIQNSHLHLGLQLIFNESQKECDNEIWIDLYALTTLLEKHKCDVYRVPETKEYYRKYDIIDPAVSEN